MCRSTEQLLYYTNLKTLRNRTSKDTLVLCSSVQSITSLCSHETHLDPDSYLFKTLELFIMLVRQQNWSANTEHLQESPLCVTNMPLFCLDPFAKLPQNDLCRPFSEMPICNFFYKLQFLGQVALPKSSIAGVLLQSVPLCRIVPAWLLESN